MKFFSLQERSLFLVHDPAGVKLLTRLWFKFDHLNEHKFRHNFKDSEVATCDCGKETKTAEHFFLRCLFFVTERQMLLKNVSDKHFSSQNLNKEFRLDILLYVYDKFNERGNKEILLHKIILTLLNVLENH